MYIYAHQDVSKTVFTHLADSRVGVLLARLSSPHPAYGRFETVGVYDFISLARNMLHAQ
jgi:hypothetical protein